MTSPEERKVVAITGAGGYLGAALGTALQKRGWETVALVRRPLNDGNQWNEQRPFSLDQEAPELQGVTALVHCAHDFSQLSWNSYQSLNVGGAVRLWDQAARSSVQTIIFVSSLAAFDGCRSMYGRAKLQVEKEVIARGGLAVRPGMIWGGSYGGLVGSLKRAAERLPVVPLVGNGRQKLFLVHVDDLCSFLAMLLEVRPRGGLLSVAHPEPLEFREIVARFARARGRTPLFFPLPAKLFLRGLQASEALHLRLPFRSDSLVSLMHCNENPSFELSSKELNVEFRGFNP